ncbi:beta-ketoacyl synthase chain length factor [Acinetobacter oleivorans]|uniref:beta-ketoacyl synthase chain length factor n=1 Tax=Acinetobacter oleivorans TaxID=1148157 RepID=UPI003A84EB2A
MVTLHLAQLIFTHAQPSYAALDCIPAMQRRRLSPLAKLALNSAIGALDSNKADYIVWVSKYGDEAKTLNILKDVLNEQTPSPTQFSTSVHNAISGLYSILCQDDTPSTSLSCSWTESLIEAYALLKSMTDINRVLVVAYDEPLPNIYAEAVDFSAYAMATVVTLEQPNLQITAWMHTDEADAPAFAHFWQDADQLTSAFGWNKC